VRINRLRGRTPVTCHLVALSVLRNGRGGVMRTAMLLADDRIQRVCYRLWVASVEPPPMADLRDLPNVTNRKQPL